MTDVSAELANKNNPVEDNSRKVLREGMALDRAYGQIGILAVAAAVRYQGVAKNPAYAPCSNKWRDRFAEVAA
jgi:hypothetical protein